MLLRSNHTGRKKIIVFSQWSRKKFAAFLSLGRVIKIAWLKVDLSEGFIKKTIRVKRQILSIKLKEEEPEAFREELFLDIAESNSLVRPEPSPVWARHCSKNGFPILYLSSSLFNNNLIKTHSKRISTRYSALLFYTYLSNYYD